MPRAPTFPPDLLERFADPTPLGEGSMGAVFRARDRALDRPVAVKVLTRPDDDELARRFDREARLMLRVDHPGVVRALDRGRSSRGPYLVMEALDGQPLSAGALGDRRKHAMLAVAEALDAVHDAGLIHRDVKPDNILLLEDGRVVLIDFGLAHDPDRTRLTGTGVGVGSLGYMCPAYLGGAASAPSMDWYALGASWFKLAEGRLPYDAAQILAIASGAPPPPLVFERLDPAGLEARALRACLHPDPAQRPATAHGLRAVLEGRAPPPPRPRGPPSPADPGPPARAPLAPPADPGPPARAPQAPPDGPGPPSRSTLALPAAPVTTATRARRPGAPGARATRRQLVAVLVFSFTAGAAAVLRLAGPSPAPGAAPVAPRPAPRTEAPAPSLLPDPLDRVLREVTGARPHDPPPDRDPADWAGALAARPRLARLVAWLAAGGRVASLPGPLRAQLAQLDRALRAQAFPSLLAPHLQLRPRPAGLDLAPSPGLAWLHALGVPRRPAGWLGTALDEWILLTQARTRLRRELTEMLEGRRQLAGVPRLVGGLKLGIMTSFTTWLELCWAGADRRRAARSWLLPLQDRLRRVLLALGRAARAPPGGELAALAGARLLESMPEAWLGEVALETPEALLGGPLTTPGGTLLRAQVLRLQGRARALLAGDPADTLSGPAQAGFRAALATPGAHRLGVERRSLALRVLVEDLEGSRRWAELRQLTDAHAALVDQLADLDRPQVLEARRRARRSPTSRSW